MANWVEGPGRRAVDRCHDYLEVLYSGAQNRHNGFSDMQVTLRLPDEIVGYLGDDPKALSRALLEGLVLEGVRSRKLSTSQARQILGIATRGQMDAFLKSHKVELPLTIDQVRHDSEIALSFSK